MEEDCYCYLQANFKMEYKARHGKPMEHCKKV
jgi:hypothetical protein